jgi:hypothetical protein
MAARAAGACFVTNPAQRGCFDARRHYNSTLGSTSFIKLPAKGSNTVMGNRVRLLFLSHHTYRKFWWFEMNGDDLYWGPSTQAHDSRPISFSGESVTITVPEQLEEAEKVQLKASYHKSGQFHVKKNYPKDSKSEIDTIYEWRKKGEINQPLRICAVISKRIDEYEIYGKSLTSKKTSALVFKVDDQNLYSRHYFEFFISLPGEFPIPMTVIKTKDAVMDTPACFSLNEKYILIVRHLGFPPNSEFNRWHPSNEIILFFEETNLDR